MALYSPNLDEHFSFNPLSGPHLFYGRFARFSWGGTKCVVGPPVAVAKKACDRQFTKRRMRMFITMPSARNMNNTDEPP